MVFSKWREAQALLRERESTLINIYYVSWKPIPIMDVNHNVHNEHYDTIIFIYFGKVGYIK